MADDPLHVRITMVIVVACNNVPHNGKLLHCFFAKCMPALPPGLRAYANFSILIFSSDRPGEIIPITLLIILFSNSQNFLPLFFKIPSIILIPNDA